MCNFKPKDSRCWLDTLRRTMHIRNCQDSALCFKIHSRSDYVKRMSKHIDRRGNVAYLYHNWSVLAVLCRVLKYIEADSRHMCCQGRGLSLQGKLLVRDTFRGPHCM